MTAFLGGEIRGEGPGTFGAKESCFGYSRCRFGGSGARAGLETLSVARGGDGLLRPGERGHLLGCDLCSDRGGGLSRSHLLRQGKKDRPDRRGTRSPTLRWHRGRFRGRGAPDLRTEQEGGRDRRLQGFRPRTLPQPPHSRAPLLDLYQPRPGLWVFTGLQRGPDRGQGFGAGRGQGGSDLLLPGRGQAGRFGHDGHQHVWRSGTQGGLRAVSRRRRVFHARLYRWGYHCSPRVRHGSQGALRGG